MKPKIPQVKEVNLELIDVNYYFDEEIKIDDIDIQLSTRASFNNEDNLIFFFIHVRYFYKPNKSKGQTLFHTDYLSIIEVDKVNWKKKKELKVEKNQLAHLLGMSFLMVRGSISNRLASNFLSQIELPLINPLKLLEARHKMDKKNFILTTDFEAGHK